MHPFSINIAVRICLSICFVAVFLVSQFVQAAAFPMHTKRIAIQEGLSQNTVLDVLQDRQGFVWVATENGLNRYDGYKVSRYHRGANGGLPDDFVYSLAEDEGGDLWIGTARGGLARWLREYDRFETVPLSLETGTDRAAPSKRTPSIRKLLVSSNNELWIGTRESGLIVRSLVDGSEIHYQHGANSALSLPSNRVNALFQDRGGLIWVGTDAGLARFDASTGGFVRYDQTMGRARGLSDNNVLAISEDRQGVLWVGTKTGGLNAYHRNNGRFVHYTPPSSYTSDAGQPAAPVHVETTTSGAFCGGAITAIVEDFSQRLWSATDQGLCMLDRSSERFTQFRETAESGDANGLGDSDLLSLMLDASGQLWVGTRSDGINLWNPQSWQLGHASAANAVGRVSSFATDVGGYWVGSASDGLLRVSADGRTRNRMRAADGLTDQRVMSLTSSDDGGLWVGSMKGGLMRLSSAGVLQGVWRADKSEHPLYKGAIPSDSVMSVMEDSRGRVWIGTYGGGVAVRAADSVNFDVFVGAQDSSAGREVGGLVGRQGMAIAEDFAGTIWVGTEQGLNRFNEQTREFDSFVHSTNSASSLSAESVYALHVDASGSLWVGTAGGGLDKAVVAGDEVSFENHSEVIELGLNLIYGIHSDRDDNLWLSGNSGLIRYTPSTRVGKKFREAHGLQGDEFNFGAHHSGLDGHLYFGGNNGFNRFDPAALNSSAASPRVALTRIQRGGRDLPALFPAEVKSVDMAYDDDMLAIEFAALDFVDASSNRFEYRLSGHDARWIDAGTARRVGYSSLSPGAYLFEVRGANSSGVWSDQPAALRVNVEAPPWRSNLAYVVYGFMAMLLLWLMYRSWDRRRAAEAQHGEELHRLAYFDLLTNLPNRHQLLEVGDQLLEDQTEQSVAVLHINLDHFKRLNDSLGHTIADKLLVEFAGRVSTLANGLIASDSEPLVARVGGDEFAVVLPGVSSIAEATVITARLQNALSETLRFERAEVLVTVSIGMAMFPDDGADMAALLKCADIAMRGAKETGRNTFRGFESAMIASTEADLQLETELHAATETDELQLYYQPRVYAADKRVCGAEALIRWNHPERGLVSPGVFIPMAERTGLITRIDRWVLQRACEQQQAWQLSRFPQSTTSLNVSGGQFARSEFLDYLRELTIRYSIEPDSLEIEITEGVLMQDARAARKTLAHIKDLGFRVAIDDFGTGYSSLSYLKNFAVDVLKIDRSFVMDLEADESNRSICRAILGLARSLNLEVVAEGVETEAQFNFLRDEGCDQIQGYWVARPEPIDTFEAFVLDSVGPGLDVRRQG